MFDSYSDSRRASRTLRSESIFRHPSIVFNDSLSIRLSTSLRLRLAWLLESGFLFLSVLRPKSSPESSRARSWSSIALNLPSIVEPLSWLASIPESVTESSWISLTEPSCIPYVLFTHGVFCEIVFFSSIFLTSIIYKHSKITWYCNLIEKCDVFSVKNNPNNQWNESTCIAVFGQRVKVRNACTNHASLF